MSPRLARPWLVLAVLAAAPAFAQGTAPPSAVNALVIFSMAPPALTFGVLTALGTLGDTPPRNGFVLNTIAFGSVALTYGAVFFGMNASTPREPIGWVSGTAGLMCVGLITTALGVFELVSMKRSGAWEGRPPPPPGGEPAGPPPAAAPPPAPPVLIPGLAPTADGRGLVLSLMGRLP